MPKEPEKEPTQRTEKGHEIPVPKRADVLGNMAKIATAPERRAHRGDRDPDESEDDTE